MPIVTVEGPRIEAIETKRNLVKEMTDSMVKAYGLPREAMIVQIKENAPENVGVGGELVSDRMGRGT